MTISRCVSMSNVVRGLTPTIRPFYIETGQPSDVSGAGRRVATFF